MCKSCSKITDLDLLNYFTRIKKINKSGKQDEEKRIEIERIFGSEKIMILRKYERNLYFKKYLLSITEILFLISCISLIIFFIMNIL